jgi:hypothetical protein
MFLGLGSLGGYEVQGKWLGWGRQGMHTEFWCGNGKVILEK